MVKGRVSEIFESIQGEGIYLGEKQLFVRFYGCNLNCQFCDTKPENFKEYHPQELLEELKSYSRSYHSVSFTGGEPLLQKDFLKEVLRLTRNHGFRNYLETNGTLPDALREVIDDVDIVAMDLKLPSSTGLADFWQHHSDFLKIARKKELFLKMIICKSTTDNDFKQGLKLIKEACPAAILVLQPNSYDEYGLLQDKLNYFRDVCVRSQVTACVIAQMHNIVGLR